MEKILDIADSLANQRGLGKVQVREVLKRAMIDTAKTIVGEGFMYEANINEEEKIIELRQKQEVVPDGDERALEQENTFIELKKAKEIDQNVEVGDTLSYEISLDAFGRVGASHLQENLEKELQILTESSLYNKYKDKMGKIVSGTVTRVDEVGTTYIEFEEIRAMLPMKNRIKGEFFKVGDVIKSVVKRVQINKKEGIRVELSRTTPKFLIELLKLEVPEIGEGSVIVEKASRIPGKRAKIAIFTDRNDIDPVGATVGVKGVRINAVSKELCGENIDVISHSPIDELFISRSMSPAIVESVTCNDKKATIKITTSQKPKAIGKNGINIRLASMLTGFEIELEEIPDTAEAQEKQAPKALADLFKE